MNFLQIFGRLGADPETKFTANGQKVTTFRVACNVRKGGKDDTMWWRVTVWGDRFDKMMPYLKKGSAVIIMGAMSKPEIYVSRDGASQVSLEITAESIHFSPFGSGRTDQAATPAETSNFGEANLSEARPSYAGVSEDFEDEPLPF